METRREEKEEKNDVWEWKREEKRKKKRKELFIFGIFNIPAAIISFRWQYLVAYINGGARIILLHG